MKRIVMFMGVLAATTGLAQEVASQEAPDAPCVADFREHGRRTERPVDPEQVADLRAALDGDLKSTQPDGLAGFSSIEPICFYWLSDGRILMRDGRGFEFYFRKIPKWTPERVDVKAQPISQ
jgi:hypothetical protein